MGSVLYTYRSCVKALPQVRPYLWPHKYMFLVVDMLLFGQHVFCRFWL